MTARNSSAPRAGSPTHLNPGSRVLEIAPGPGYLAIALAKLTGGRITGVDISRTFVQIAAENARQAGVAVDFEHGDAADLPFPDGQFDFIVCRAAFKNFTRPLVALNEMHRVLKEGGTALVIDLRKDYSPRAVSDYCKDRGFVSAAIIKLTFRTMLKSRAYSQREHDGTGGAVAVRARRDQPRSDRIRTPAAQMICSAA